MFGVDIKHLHAFPNVYQFLCEDKDFDNIISINDVKATYQIPVASLYDKSKFPIFTLSEICVLFSAMKQLDYLIQHFDIRSHIERRNYRVFRIATENNEVEILDRLIAFNKDSIQSILSPYNYHILRIAVKNNHIDMVKKLITLSNEKCADMVAAHRYEALDIAIKAQFTALTDIFLSYDFVFRYVIKHDKYNPVVFQYLESFFNTLDTSETDPFITSHHLNLAIEILKYLLDLSQDNPQDIVCADRIRILMSYDNLRKAIQSSH